MRKMSTGLALVLVLANGCGGNDDSTRAALPQVYPPVRANTPDALINDPAFSTASVPHSQLGSPNAKAFYAQSGTTATIADAPGEESFAQIIQERLYSAGPTEVLSLLKDLDDRTATLDTRVSEHACLATTPIAKTYTLPGGQTFTAMLQCISIFSGGDNNGWVAFGFDIPQSDAAGAAANHDFYLVEGQTNGLGGVYHVDVASGDVEAWIAVADQTIKTNTQALMHLQSMKAAATLELTLAGIGDGFCAAHLKTNAGNLFIRAKTPTPGMIDVTNGAPQSCNAQESACFATSALDTDLGGDSTACAAVGAATFGIAIDLDADGTGGNVQYSTIYTYFDTQPTDVPSF